MRVKNASHGDVLLKDRTLSALLWLVPVLSVGDVLWALSAKMGLVITFGLGLYKWDMIHVLIQAGLIVLLSLVFVARSGSGAGTATDPGVGGSDDAGDGGDRDPASVGGNSRVVPDPDVMTRMPGNCADGPGEVLTVREEHGQGTESQAEK